MQRRKILPAVQLLGQSQQLQAARPQLRAADQPRREAQRLGPALRALESADFAALGTQADHPTRVLSELYARRAS